LSKKPTACDVEESEWARVSLESTEKWHSNTKHAALKGCIIIGRIHYGKFKPTRVQIQNVPRNKQVGHGTNKLFRTK
jgi:hypothetical protein